MKVEWKLEFQLYITVLMVTKTQSDCGCFGVFSSSDSAPSCHWSVPWSCSHGHALCSFLIICLISFTWPWLPWRLNIELVAGNLSLISGVPSFAQLWFQLSLVSVIFVSWMILVSLSACVLTFSLDSDDDSWICFNKNSLRTCVLHLTACSSLFYTCFNSGKVVNWSERLLLYFFQSKVLKRYDINMIFFSHWLSLLHVYCLSTVFYL